MAENRVWAAVEDMLDIPEWLQSADVLSILFFVTSVVLFYLVMTIALKAISVLFWPTAIIVGLLYFQNETFAAALADCVIRITENFKGCNVQHDHIN
uniref:Uncharacterized protein n=1 Tax=Anopheles atroparvus TaxID=41427 RepID=A0AAG5DE30_ANOAO